jgi:hypothetical protein
MNRISLFPKRSREYALGGQVNKHAEGIGEIGRLVSRILNKDHTHLTKISFSFPGGKVESKQGPIAAAAPVGYIICVEFDDGTCGCEADPPGISFPC